MKIGHDEHRDDDGPDALVDRVLAQGRADLLFLERLGLRLAGRLPDRRIGDQEVELLGREPLRAALDDPRVADLRVDRRGRLDHAVEQDGELVLELAALLGQVLAGQVAELAAARAVEGEADGRLEWSSCWALGGARTCR